MPGAFTIITATNTVTLGPDRQGEAAFVVTNVSGRPIQGRALLTWQPPATDRAAWASVQGDTERVFPIAGTQQYAVKFTLPSTAPEGQHILRLDMQDVTSPDDVVQGQSVTLQVTAPPPKKPFPWWVVIVAAVVLLGGIGAFVLLRPRQATVPVVAGQSLVKAQELIAAAGLRVAEPLKDENSDTLAQGLVIRSEPAEGTTQARGTAVTLVASSGPATFPMPNVVGSAASAAVIALQQAGITKFALDRRYSETVPAEQVIDTTPGAGQPVTKAGEVRVAVSLGPCRRGTLVCRRVISPVLISPNLRFRNDMLRVPDQP